MQFRRSWLVEQYPSLLVFFIIVKLLVFGLFKQYRGWWRYVGISDLTGILQASLVSTLIIVSLWTSLIFAPAPVRESLEYITHVGQGVFVADLFITFLLLAGLRMAVRLYYEEFRTVEGGRLKRFLIVGAGNAGEALLREIQRMPETQYEVIGFIDDDPVKQGLNIHGISVLGSVELSRYVKALRFGSEPCRQSPISPRVSSAFRRFGTLILMTCSAGKLSSLTWI
ncbi:MAG: hypothetical protein ACYSR4_03890 [Planctomycetota bacterium]